MTNIALRILFALLLLVGLGACESSCPPGTIDEYVRYGHEAERVCVEVTP
jgi:hypothetical protein